ncbi:MAG: putative metal-binding motif-containing protein [Patescibacteria group bacterium]
MHPGATEVCDGQDNNCDGLVDNAECATARAMERMVEDEHIRALVSPSPEETPKNNDKPRLGAQPRPLHFWLLKSRFLCYS